MEPVIEPVMMWKGNGGALYPTEAGAIRSVRIARAAAILKLAQSDGSPKAVLVEGLLACKDGEEPLLVKAAQAYNEPINSSVAPPAPTE